MLTVRIDADCVAETAFHRPFESISQGNSFSPVEGMGQDIDFLSEFLQDFRSSVCTAVIDDDQVVTIFQYRGYYIRNSAGIVVCRHNHAATPFLQDCSDGIWTRNSHRNAKLVKTCEKTS